MSSIEHFLSNHNCSIIFKTKQYSSNKCFLLFVELDIATNITLEYLLPFRV